MSEPSTKTVSTTTETKDPLAGVNHTTIVTNDLEEYTYEPSDGIRLHFLRYGLFAKHNKDEHLVSPNEKEGQQQEVSLPAWGANNPPSLEHFYVGITALNSGYLYMFDANDPDLFYEYKLNSDGRAQTIYEPVFVDDNRTNNGNIEDHRVSSGQYEVKKDFKKDQVLWIGYSQVQWTGTYYQNIIGASDSEREAVGMIRVECKGFPEGSGQEHVLQQSEVIATFTEDRKDADAWMDSILGQINAYEVREQPEIKKDMFVVLSDPIGCALDMSETIGNELIRHKAMVESMRSGRDPETIEQQLKSNSIPSSYNEVEKEQVAMVTLAQTVYQHIYTSPDMMEAYADQFVTAVVRAPRNGFKGSISNKTNIQDGVNQEKLEIVLAKELRKEKRELINALQQDLGVYIFDPYYMNAYHHDIESDGYNILGSKLVATQIYRGLAVDPHDVDRSFDLPDVEVLPRPWMQNIRESISIEDAYNIYVLLNFEIEEDNSISENKEDLANKFFDFVSGTLEVFSKQTATELLAYSSTRTLSIPVPDIYPAIIRRLNTASAINGINFQVDTFGNINLSRIGISNLEVQVPRIKIVSIEVDTPVSATARSINQSGALKSLSMVVHIFNLNASFMVLYRDPSARNAIALAGAIVELSEATLQLSAFIAQRTSGRVSSSVVKYIRVLNGVGTAITMAVSIVDASKSFGEGDTSSGVAHSIAAAAFAGALLVPGGALIVGLFLLTGFIFTLLGIAWMRTELERFFQDFAFSNKIPFPSSPRLPHSYNRILSNSRSTYTSYGSTLSSELYFFQDDLAWYMNQILSVDFSIDVNPDNLMNSVEGSFGLRRGLLDRFSLVITTNFNIIKEEQVEYSLLFQNEDRTIVSLDHRYSHVSIVPGFGPGSIRNRILITIDIPHERFGEFDPFAAPDALFFCKFDLQEQGVYPMDYVGKTFYLGKKLNSFVAINEHRGILHDTTNGLIVDTMENFMSGKAW